jgi:hypothetical protein
MARGKNKLTRRDRERRAPKAGTNKANELAAASPSPRTCAHPALTHQVENRLSALLKKVFVASFNVSVPRCHALLLQVAQDGLVSDPSRRKSALRISALTRPVPRSGTLSRTRSSRIGGRLRT